jgi:acyl-coenzyme A synthetase/AMP-(fatty) acid ligase
VTEHPFNAAELLLSQGAAQRPALVEGAQRWTYGALRVEVARAAAAWTSLGVAVGDRVLIGLADGAQAAIALLGAMWSGAVAVMANPRQSAAQWQAMAGQVQARCLLLDAGAAVPAGLGARVLDPHRWQALVGAATARLAHAAGPEQDALWTFSSGTSGTPKVVRHAHCFALAVHGVADQRLGITAADRLYASSRLFFVYPLANSLFAGLRVGATVVLDAAWPTASGTARVVAGQAPTVLFTVPSLLRDLLAEGHDAALRGLRLAVSAGEALPPRLRAAWLARTGVPLVDGWGCSETMCLMLLDHGQGLLPAPGVQVRWAEPAPPLGQPGRLCVRAPTLALGYWQRPREQAESFREQGFCPGDLFEPGARGGWVFVGREDSLVKLGARWVDLGALAESLHEALGDGHGVRELAAVTAPDADGVQALALFFVPRSAGEGDAAGVPAALDRALQDLPAHQRPRWCHALPELPRTATGKLLRRRLLELHEERVGSGRCA